MDRALKERIIGAIVLVAFAVLVVPVFLDGPSKHGAEISETISLPGQNGQANKQQTIVLNRNRSEPVPATALDAGSADEASTSQRAVSNAPEPSGSRPASPPPTQRSDANQPRTVEQGPRSATGMWAVQLGSFSNKQNAERLAADLRASGYAAFLSQLNNGDSSLHRVRVGPQKDRENAESVAGKLASEGHRGQVVPHP